ncbi:MAG TPA: GNAT family N-acetyltransferase [Amycolatopsis sp.]|uniref:GNAT family N-acetyltransferase n=1 Tax=Amycolatopsis nalaikhensis TaxID=715472 RepID=A0ABY8XZK3_9PSEU|nr:GNAT family N-acetyltransferase [Amycolatopsis sp. 2-2]WIV61038.1 GNAT family N-acetyltransferase [Amycolatopsis sp. 2-2]
MREIRVDADGVPVLSYLRRENAGRPWADRVEVLGDGAAEVALREMSGWAATAPRSFAGELVARGARELRATHRMTLDLSVRRPPGAWENATAPPLRCEPFDRPVDDLIPAWRAAYAPGHPDYRPEYEDVVAVRDRFEALAAGTSFGPLSPLSGVVSHDGVVVAGLLLNEFPGEVPWGGFLITDLFRHPAYPQAGTLLLRWTLARAAAVGLGVVGLVVTDGNPARRLYERHGFEVFESPMTVAIP